MPIEASNPEILLWSAPNVAQNLALDETLARSAGETGRALLRFWWGGPPAVVLGFGDCTEQAVDQSACARLGVDVLKRHTGGGAVLQTGGVFNYSLTLPASQSVNPKGTFRLGTDLVRAILQTFELPGIQEGISDVAVGGRKISGNAQARRRRSLLVHGTLLMDFDYEIAEQVLRHPAREPLYRQHRSHRDFMVTLREVGVRLDRSVIERKAVEAAEATFGPARGIPADEHFLPPFQIRHGSSNDAASL